MKRGRTYYAIWMDESGGHFGPLFQSEAVARANQRMTEDVIPVHVYKESELRDELKAAWEASQAATYVPVGPCHATPGFAQYKSFDEWYDQHLKERG